MILHSPKWQMRHIRSGQNNINKAQRFKRCWRKGHVWTQLNAYVHLQMSVSYKVSHYIWSVIFEYKLLINMKNFEKYTLKKGNNFHTTTACTIQNYNKTWHFEDCNSNLIYTATFFCIFIYNLLFIVNLF